VGQPCERRHIHNSTCSSQQQISICTFKVSIANAQPHQPLSWLHSYEVSKCSTLRGHLGIEVWGNWWKGYKCKSTSEWFLLRCLLCTIRTCLYEYQLLAGLQVQHARYWHSSDTEPKAAGPRALHNHQTWSIRSQSTTSLLLNVKWCHLHHSSMYFYGNYQDWWK